MQRINAAKDHIDRNNAAYDDEDEEGYSDEWEEGEDYYDEDEDEEWDADYGPFGFGRMDFAAFLKM